MSALTIELPDALQKSIEDIASKEGYTAGQFLAAAAAEKLAAVMTINYLREEATQGRRSDFERYLQSVPDVAPVDDDRLP